MNLKNIKKKFYNTQNSNKEIMRREIVVLGFFIIALILIAGCTSSQNATATGIKKSESCSRGFKC